MSALPGPVESLRPALPGEPVAAGLGCGLGLRVEKPPPTPQVISVRSPCSGGKKLNWRRGWLLTGLLFGEARGGPGSRAQRRG